MSDSMSPEETAALHKLRNQQQIEQVVDPRIEKMICRLWGIDYR